MNTSSIPLLLTAGEFDKESGHNPHERRALRRAGVLTPDAVTPSGRELYTVEKARACKAAKKKSRS